MTISSARSSSPISSRTNPNPRTSESNCSIRKSFSGNPFTRPSIVRHRRSFNPVTPANSPAGDLSNRSSVCKEGLESLRVSFEQKENDKDHNLKPSRIRSPVLSKGMKNFMAPTISAASKITPSPKKKVLTERNETVRTSSSICSDNSPFTVINLSEFVDETARKSEMVSDSQVSSGTHNSSEALSEPLLPDSDYKEANVIVPLVCEALGSISNPQSDIPSSVPVSDGKPQISSMNPLDFAAIEEVKPVAVLSTPVFSDTHKISDSLSGSINVESKSHASDFGSRVEPPYSPSPVVHSLDGDLSLAPYDPKTNYLSPRPRFLHYRPNPRIEVYLDKERGFDPGEGKRLQDRFTSESCSDTETIDDTQSPDSQKESDSSEIVSEENTEAHISEPESYGIHKQKEVARVKRISKLCFFKRSKSIPLFLVLVIACLSFTITDSPVFSSLLFKGQAFSKHDAQIKIYEFAKENLDGLSSNLRLWSVNSISYLTNLISHSIEAEHVDPLDEGPIVDGHMTNGLGDDRKEKEEQSVLDPKEEGGVEEEQKGEQIPLVNVAEAEIEEEVTEELSRLIVLVTEIEPKKSAAEEIQPEKEREVEEEQKDEQSFLVDEAAEEEATEEIQPKNDVDSYSNSEVTSAEFTREQTEIDIEAQSSLISQASEIMPGISEAEEYQSENYPNSCMNSEPSNPAFALQGSESKARSHGMQTLESALHRFDDQFLERNALGISSVVLILVAVATFLYIKQVKSTTPNAAFPVEQLPPKKFTTSSISVSTDHSYHEKPPSRNWPMEAETVGESGPSEISSSFPSPSHSRRGSDRANEVQSHERIRMNSNRESLASSSGYSAGSPSYGSFTSYEKIHIKLGYGDEEVVTPVRRSSRIRKQVTSP